MTHAPRAETGLAVSGALGAAGRKKGVVRRTTPEKKMKRFSVQFIGKPGRKSPVFFQETMNLRIFRLQG
jgi:hypothetical protein